MAKNIISGIYTITNLIDGKMYVGYASDLHDRRRVHFGNLVNKKHCNKKLQNAVNYYGINSFLFEILEECPEEYLVALEHYWCTILNTRNKAYGYNLRPTHPYDKHPKGHKFKLSKDTIKWRKENYKLDENRKKKSSENAKATHIINIGKKRSKISKLRMSLAKHKIPTIIEIFYENGQYFDSVFTQMDASKITGVKRSNLANNLCGLAKSAGGYIFTYKNKESE